jgi:hypothetical protein
MGTEIGGPNRGNSTFVPRRLYSAAWDLDGNPEQANARNRHSQVRRHRPDGRIEVAASVVSVISERIESFRSHAH